MKQYLNLLEQILTTGNDRGDRTGTGARSVFGVQLKYDLQQGFPLVTTKKMFTRGIIEELLWMISGSTDVQVLIDKNVHIWDSWRRPDGTLGPVYGEQWRYCKGIDEQGMLRTVDQLQQCIDLIKHNPESRRIIVSSWNVAQIDDMQLPPCHCFFQFYVRGEFLDLQLYQRSADCFLGVPFNIAQYSLLLSMVAQVTGKKPGMFTHTIGDAHIYSNHFEQVKEQLSRMPHELPKLVLNESVKNIDDFKVDDIKIEGYECWPAIKAPVAV